MSCLCLQTSVIAGMIECVCDCFGLFKLLCLCVVCVAVYVYVCVVVYLCVVVCCCGYLMCGMWKLCVFIDVMCLGLYP